MLLASCTSKRPWRGERESWITPLSSFSWRRRLSIFSNEMISGGILPQNWFLIKSILINFLQWLMSDRMLPVRLLEESLKTWRFASFPSSGVTELESLFPEKPIIDRLLQRPKTAGMFPSSKFPLSKKSQSSSPNQSAYSLKEDCHHESPS